MLSGISYGRSVARSAHGLSTLISRALPGVAMLAVAAMVSFSLALESSAQTKTIELSVSPSSLLESNVGDQTLTVTATLSAAAESDMTVSVTVTDLGGASDGYVPVGTINDFNIAIEQGNTEGEAKPTLTLTHDEEIHKDNVLTFVGTAPDYTVTAATLTVFDVDKLPVLRTAKVKANTLTLSYDKEMNSAGADVRRFTVHVDGSTNNLPTIAVAIGSNDAAKDVELTLLEPVKAGQTVTVGYDAVTGDGNRLMDTGDNRAASFEGRTVDNQTTIPSVTLGGPKGPENGAFTLTVTFSEPIVREDFTSDDITVNNGDIEKGTTGPEGKQYMFTITPTSSFNGTLTADIAANVATSAASGTPNSAARRFSVVVDQTPPTVSITVPTSVQRRHFSVIVTFSENMADDMAEGKDGFVVGDFNITGGEASDLVPSTARVYRATITPLANATTVKIEIRAGKAEDLAGNLNTAATAKNVMVNKDDLTASIEAPTAVQTRGEFDVVFIFSSTVQSFVKNNIGVSNGRVVDGPEKTSGAGTRYTAAIEPLGTNEVEPVEVMVSVTGQIMDVGGEAYPNLDPKIVMARVGPTVTIGELTKTSVAGVYNLSIIFSSAVTGFAANDIQVDNGRVTGGDYPSGQLSYTAEITPAEDGPMIVKVPANAARTTTSPSYGNRRSDPSDPKTFTVDVPPAVTITGPSGTVSGSFAVTITFTDLLGVIGLVKGDLVVTGRAAVGQLTPPPTETVTTYTATIIPSADGRVTVSVPASVVEDTGGNPNLASNTYSVNVNLAAAEGISLSASPSTVTEDDGPTTIRVTASVAGGTSYTTDRTVTVNVSGSGTQGVVGFAPVADFAIIIRAGSRSATESFTLTPVNDTSVRSEETITIAGTADNGDPVRQTTVTLRDDDGESRGVTLTASPTTVRENAGATTISVTATVTGGGVYAEAVRVAVRVGGTDALGVVGFSPVNRFDITIRANARSASGSFTLTPRNNRIDEQNETVRITGDLSNDAPVTGTTITITDDDAAPGEISLAVTPESASEGAASTPIRVTATIGGGTTFTTDQTVAISVTGSGEAGVVGFAAVTGFDLTILSGESTGGASFTLRPVQNIIDEADETITVTGTRGDLTYTATLMLTDDDEAPTGITLAADPNVVAESAPTQTVTLRVSVDGGSAYVTEQTISVTVDGSGAAGVVGFDPVDDFTLTIPAGASSAIERFLLKPINNTADETDETVTVTGTHGEDSYTTTITITDDDAPPTGVLIAASPATISEGAGTTNVLVAASVQGGTTYATEQTISVTVDGSGTAGVVGFQAVESFDITIPAATAISNGTFALTPEDNVIDESDETVTITGTFGETSLTTTLTLTDDDAAPTGIALSVDPATVSEDAGATTVTVTATVEGGTTYARDQTVTLSVGGTNNAGVVGFDPVVNFDVTVMGGMTTGAASFMLTPENDVIDEADETITIAGKHGERDLSTTLLLTDDDAEPTGIALSTNPATVSEGAGATTVTVTATVEGGTTYASDQTVSIAFSGSGSAGVVGFASLPDISVVVDAGEATGTASFSLTPVDNNVDESDETITLTGNHAGNSLATTLTLEDDDATPTDITLQADPAAISEDAGATTVTVTALVEGGTTYGVEQTVRISVSGSGSSNVVGFAPVSGFDIVVAAATSSAVATFTITPEDNRIREVNETVSITGSHAGANPSTTLTLVDDDAAMARFTEVSQVLLPELARAMTSSTINAVAGRVEDASSGRSDQMAMSVGGYSSLGGFMRGIQTRRRYGAEGLGMRDRLSRSSFSFQPMAGLGGRVTFWGNGDFRSISGGSSGIVQWDGNVTGAHLGTDARIGDSVLIGLALSRTGGSLDYTYTGIHSNSAGAKVNGAYGTSMLGVHPYISWSWSPGSTIWASGGYGGGQVEIDDSEAATESSDSRMTTYAAGATVRLVGGANTMVGSSSTTLAVKGEAWQSAFELDDNGSLIEASSVSVHRIRLALEGAYRKVTDSGSMVSPFLELGLRSDGGDGQTGTGLELGGGVRYASASSGLKLEGRGRTLLIHGADIQEWGFGGTIGYAPGADGRGLSIEVGSSSGSFASGMGRLWSDRMITRQLGASRGLEPRLNSEVGYGVDVAGGVVRPYTGVDMSEYEGLSTRLGANFMAGPRFRLGLEVERRALPGDVAPTPLVRGTITLY